MHLRQPGFICMLVGDSQNTNKELRSLYKQEIQIISTRMILIKLVLLMMQDIVIVII